MQGFLYQSDNLKNCFQKFCCLVTTYLNLNFQNLQWLIHNVVDDTSKKLPTSVKKYYNIFKNTPTSFIFLDFDPLGR
jgi:hypothetical protein